LKVENQTEKKEKIKMPTLKDKEVTIYQYWRIGGKHKRTNWLHNKVKSYSNARQVNRSNTNDINVFFSELLKNC
jgi:hypothetical protein